MTGGNKQQMITAFQWSRRALICSLVFIVVVGALPWGCASIDDGIEPPHISLVKITPLKSDNLESAFQLDLRLVNPNDRTFRLRGITCKLDINGSTIAAGSSNTPAELPQLGTAVLQGIGVSDSDVETLVADFRRDDYALMQEVQGT